MPILPRPPTDRPGVLAWVRTHLGHLSGDDVAASAIPGGQAAADAALAGLDLTGYARRRSIVLPERHRGATRLSPYIRHGLLAAHPDLPAVFVFDEPLLAGLRLSGKRLVFLAEGVAELGAEVRLGGPVTELRGRPLATTWAYVPGWKTRAAALDPAALHPWPWLRRPDAGSLQSYSAWVRRRPAGAGRA